MKIRLLTAVCFIALTCTCFAQDIIITKDAKRINAKVTEVNVDNVRYKNFDNQDGPVYTLLKSNIASILYQNGEVETFEVESPRQAEPAQSAPVTIQTTPTQTRAQIASSGNLLTDMQTFSPALYNQYTSGKRTARIGNILLWSGCAMSLTGYLSILITNDSSNETMTIFGTVLSATGGICITAGIPLLIVGSSRKNGAIRNFNRQYYSSQPASPYFQMNVYPNRVGVAYVF